MNRLQRRVAEYLKRNARLTKKASDEIVARVKFASNMGEVDKIVESVYVKYGIISERKKLVVDAVVDSVALGVGKDEFGAERVKSVKRWFLEKAYSPDTANKGRGVKFSDKINDLDRIDEVVADIRQSLKAGRAWRSAAQDLMDKKIQVADVPADIQKVIDLARKAHRLSDNSAGYAEYLAEVKKVQRRISGLVDQDTSKLKRAYQDILDITNKSSVTQLENAVKYASYYKERYNAERIVRTEMARAYGDAAITDNLYDDDAIGIRFVLSSGHDIVDVCNFHCGADLYGMGAGGYPKDHAPAYPFHPNCMCSIEQIIEGEESPAKAKDFNGKAGERYLDKLSEKNKVALLGKDGVAALEENPKAWHRHLKDWHGHETKTPTVPKKVLYGG